MQNAVADHVGFRGALIPASDPDLARLREDMAVLVGDDVAGQGYLVAVSGGPDSMALLALTAAAFPRVEAATFDHQLRTESADEAAMVGDWCAQAGIAHAILRPEMPITGNIQSAARAARYRYLESHRAARKLDWIVTAHHADDQAETLLMRLNRSSGVGGMAGVRARNGAVLRPLLGWRRGELAAIVERLALPHVLDPSNGDARFDRVAMRQHLRDADWIDPRALARSAQALAQAEEALEWSVLQIARDHVRSSADGAMLVLDRTDLPREMLRRLLLHMITRIAPAAPPPRGETLDQALVQLFVGKKAMIGDLLLKGGRSWSICAAPPRKGV